MTNIPVAKHWEKEGKEGKKTLLFTGMNTDQCVLGTLVDAYSGGWDCVMWSIVVPLRHNGGRGFVCGILGTVMALWWIVRVL